MDEEIVIIMEYMDAMKTLCAVNDGDCALLYAYAAASGGKCRLHDAALHTGFDEKRIGRAKSLLIMYKICKTAGAMPSFAETEYSPAELLAAQRGDPSFRGICDYLEQALGRSIRKSEIEILYGIYDRLNMPADVIMLMINYCKSKGRLSARELERRAYEWHDKGIVTYSAAAELADMMDKKSVERRRIMSVFGMGDRKPSETEEKYIEAWLEMEMDEDMIRMAYDRTVLRTGKLQWKYLHRILEEWHRKGLKNRRQVELAEGGADIPAVETAPPRTQPLESVVTTVTRAFEKAVRDREETQAARLAELRAKSPEFAQIEVDLGRLTIQRARAGLGGMVDMEELDRRHQALLSRRREVLAAMGKDESYILLQPKCSKCGDRGYIGNQMCECLKRACIEEEQRRKRLSAE
ncbi:MAG: DnaD domain protein [Clostridia bacterium]|nr:DnaD domain protein [Clostridia bacterium]